MYNDLQQCTQKHNCMHWQSQNTSHKITKALTASRLYVSALGACHSQQALYCSRILNGQRNAEKKNPAHWPQQGHSTNSSSRHRTTQKHQRMEPREKPTVGETQPWKQTAAQNQQGHTNVGKLPSLSSSSTQSANSFCKWRQIYTRRKATQSSDHYQQMCKQRTKWMQHLGVRRKGAERKKEKAKVVEVHHKRTCHDACIHSNWTVLLHNLWARYQMQMWYAFQWARSKSHSNSSGNSPDNNVQAAATDWRCARATEEDTAFPPDRTQQSNATHTQADSKDIQTTASSDDFPVFTKEKEAVSIDKLDKPAYQQLTPLHATEFLGFSSINCP